MQLLIRYSPPHTLSSRTIFPVYISIETKHKVETKDDSRYKLLLHKPWAEMFGQVSHELEVNAPATRAWEIYGTLRLAEMVVEELPDIVQKIDVIEGDGGLGTVLRLSFKPGTPGLTFSVEKFTKYDNEKRMKEAEVIEGGYLDLGFTLYRVRFEIIEKGIGSCIIRSTIEYDVKDDFAANASLVTVQLFADIAQVAAQHLTKQE